MKTKLLLVFVVLTSFSLKAQTLGGYQLLDYLSSATHPTGCSDSFVTGWPDTLTWVNFGPNTNMTASFSKKWVNYKGNDLLLETSFNPDNYKVRLTYTNGLKSKWHEVDSSEWTDITKTTPFDWVFDRTSCIADTFPGMHHIIALDFAADFGLTKKDTVDGLEIEFIWTYGAPDFAGAYIIDLNEDTSCAPLSASFSHSRYYDTVLLTSTSTGDIVDWLWTFGDGTSDRSANPKKVVPCDFSLMGCITVYDSCGNSDTQCYDLGTPCPGFGEMDHADFRHYPNPAKEFMIIELPADVSTANLEIFDVNGQLRKQTVLADSKGKVNIQDLEPGLYFMQIEHPVGVLSSSFVKSE